MHYNKRKVLAIIILAVFAGAMLYIKSILMLFYPLKYGDLISKYSSEYGVDPYLVSAVINVESGYRPGALSRRNARGLMQITPATGKWAAEKIGIADFDEGMLYSPDVNIHIGCWYLRYLEDEFGEIAPDVTAVLAAYNGGTGNVKKWVQNGVIGQGEIRLDEIPFKETGNYIQKVTNNIKIYRWLYDL